MALFVPVIIGVPIGYFTWSKVFNSVDNYISQTWQQDESNSTVASTVGTVGSIGVLSKLMFPATTRHRLFFAKAPINSNIRIETLKMGIELLVRSGIVFYGGAVGGAIAGRAVNF